MSELLKLHAGVLDELRLRAIIRSCNGPSGDYAEIMFSRSFGWNLENNSSAGYDAMDERGTRFQIKCRLVTAKNPPRQMSALRNLLNDPFDILAAVLLDEGFSVSQAALIPIAVIIEKSTVTKHVNAYRFILRDSVWSLPGVINVTDVLKRTQRSI